jgi:cytochrome P450
MQLITGNIYLIFLGGYETTSTALTFAFYLIAKHQNVQDRLREDILLNGHRSQYLDMVILAGFYFYYTLILFELLLAIVSIW